MNGHRDIEGHRQYEKTASFVEKWGWLVLIIPIGLVALGFALAKFI